MPTAAAASVVGAASVGSTYYMASRFVEDAGFRKWMRGDYSRVADWLEETVLVEYAPPSWKRQVRIQEDYELSEDDHGAAALHRPLPPPTAVGVGSFNIGVAPFAPPSMSEPGQRFYGRLAGLTDEAGAVQVALPTSGGGGGGGSSSSGDDGGGADAPPAAAPLGAPSINFAGGAPASALTAPSLSPIVTDEQELPLRPAALDGERDEWRRSWRSLSLSLTVCLNLSPSLRLSRTLTQVCGTRWRRSWRCTAAPMACAGASPSSLRSSARAAPAHVARPRP